MSDSDDDFAAFADDFADIDWTAVPDLNPQPPALSPLTTANIEDGTYDDLPDPFIGVDFNAVPALANEHVRSALHHTNSTIAATPPPLRPQSSHSSSHYSFDDIDETALAQVDAIERSFEEQAAADSRRSVYVGTSYRVQTLGAAQISGKREMLPCTHVFTQILCYSS